MTAQSQPSTHSRGLQRSCIPTITPRRWFSSSRYFYFLFIVLGDYTHMTELVTQTHNRKRLIFSLLTGCNTKKGSARHKVKHKPRGMLCLDCFSSFRLCLPCSLWAISDPLHFSFPMACPYGTTTAPAVTGELDSVLIAPPLTLPFRSSCTLERNVEETLTHLQICVKNTS